MSWNEQTESMMKVWTEAQRKMWENWYDLMQVAPTPTLLPMTMFDQWLKVSTQGSETWKSGTEAVSTNIYRQLLSSQNAMMRFLDLSTKAWRAMAPKLDSGEDWQSVLSEYTEQFRRQFIPDPTAMVQLSQDVGELWTLYLREVQGLSRPWFDSFQRVPGHIGEVFGGNGKSTSELIELTSLYWDAFERTFGRLLQSPGVGFAREFYEKLLKGFDAWLDFRRTSIEYQVVMADAWTKIFERVMQESIKRAEEDKPIQSLRDLIRLWTGVADETLADVFRSEAYVQAQGRLFTATMKYRMHEQDIVETFLKPGYIPTRSEVDEAHRNIYELRKEVKALKKALKQSQDGVGGKSPIADLRKEINALKKTVKDLQENNQAPAQAEVPSGD